MPTWLSARRRRYNHLFGLDEVDLIVSSLDSRISDAEALRAKQKVSIAPRSHRHRSYRVLDSSSRLVWSLCYRKRKRRRPLLPPLASLDQHTVRYPCPSRSPDSPNSSMSLRISLSILLGQAQYHLLSFCCHRLVDRIKYNEPHFHVAPDRGLIVSRSKRFSNA